MAKKSDGGVGHNSGEPLTDDEVAALSQYYSLKIRAQQRKAAEAKTAYDLEREEVNGLFAKVKGDLHYTRKEYEEVLALQDMTEAEFRHHEAKRTGRLIAGGLPVGKQLELALGDTVDDKNEAYQNGYRAGRRADDPVVPDTISPILATDWTKGWHDGQAANAAQLSMAEGILAARAKPAVGLEAEDPEEEEEEDLHEVAERAARKLKKSGWTEPTPEEASFADA